MANTKITSRVIADNAVGISALNVSDGSDGQVLTTNGSGTLSFADGGVAGITSSADATAITIDSSENVGIGVTPAAWKTSGAEKVLQIDTASLYNNSDNNVYLNSNWFLNSSGQNVYIESDFATSFAQVAGNHIWYGAASGTAGNTATLSEHMRIDTSGRLLVGLTGASGFGTVETDTLTTTGQCILARTGGNVGIGTNSPSSYNASDKLALVGTGNTSMVIAAGTSGESSVFMADGTSGTAPYMGYLQYHHSDNHLRIGVNAEEKIRITSGGNVGIGKTPNRSRKLEVAGDINLDNGGSLEWEDGGVGIAGSGATDVMTFATAGAEKMRLDNSAQSGGSLRIGTTVALASSPEKVSIQGAIGVTIKTTDYDNYPPLTLWNNASTANNSSTLIYASFSSLSNGAVGSITSVGTTTSYNTSSDYRLKENVDYTWDATTRLKQLKPARFNFISDADKIVDGFLAHEVQDIVPEAITGQKDAMKEEEYKVTPEVLDEDGNVVTEAVWGTRTVPDYQGIDQSKLVPLLTKVLQEQQTIIDDLKSRIETLEE